MLPFWIINNFNFVKIDYINTDVIFYFSDIITKLLSIIINNIIFIHHIVVTVAQSA